MAIAAQPVVRPEDSAATYERLKDLLAEMGSVVVAFSGGVDSSVVAAAARDALDKRALAVTACSPTYPAHEKERAVEVARLIGIRHLLVDSREVDNADFRQNPPNRCYHCKRELCRELRIIADREHIAALVDGSNVDDGGDYRPGREAAHEAGVRSPLAELGIGKAGVRALAKMRGLPNWDAPACACLASRIPYGEEITRERLAHIDNAETALHELGFRVVRVRDHGAVARIEVEAGDIGRALQPATRGRIIDICTQQGYTYVCLDLEGYRTGSMNAVLDPRAAN